MCSLSFNEDRVSQQSTFASVGESLTAVGTSDLANADYTGVVEVSWFNQRLNYNYNENTCSTVCGFYTQVRYFELK